jgi:hypothetical protein
MPLPLELLRKMEEAEPADAWVAILDHAWALFSATLSPDTATGEIMRREREIASLDLFLSTAAYDLWKCCGTNAPSNSHEILCWWAANPPGRAVLILDGLSAREVPWLLQTASSQGYMVHRGALHLAEIPAETTPFAKALGFAQRSALSNGMVTSNSGLSGSRTECTDLPWADCASWVPTHPDLFLWHEWPDSRMHELSDKGAGLETLVKEAAAQLTSKDFWSLIHRLTQGRRLLITSDHGYAATGQFANTEDEQQAKYLQQSFASGRSAPGGAVGPWVPPLDVRIESPHGPHRLVLGRRKWRSPGGYPTLLHGGLSVLEAAVPFIEISHPLNAGG